MHPQVLQADVPSPSLQHHQGHHPADHAVRQRRRQLVRRGDRVVDLDDRGVVHRLQPASRQRLGQRPPSAPGHVAHHRDAVDPWTIRAQSPQPAGGFVQRQFLADQHRGDQRIVDYDGHGTSELE